MKKFLIAMTAVSSLAMAGPAAAQWGRANTNANANANAYGAASVDNRLARLEARIQAGVQSGAIDRTEARNLRMQLRDIRRLERQYSANGLSGQERADLQMRLRSFRDQLRLADGGGNGYGWGNNGYGNNGYGTGGPYEQCVDEDRNDRGGIGGIFDSIFGGGNSRDDVCTGLTVGSRVSGNLRAVPWQYRTQYRDGNGVYYRSDGLNIYQIDARTNTVIRVYAMNR